MVVSLTPIGVIRGRCEMECSSCPGTSTAGSSSGSKIRCLVKLTMGKNFEDEAFFDIVPMDAGHILFDRPWLYDHYMDHRAKPKTNSFYRGKKKYTLHPLKEEEMMELSVPLHAGS